MAEHNELTLYIEAYVDTQQGESVDAIAFLIKNGTLTLEALVREMGMYLTTTDDIIRARGILLLAEVLTRIASKPLDSATVHSLIGFFKDRLADWKALQGAVVGCLALIRRKSNMGMVTGSDAKAVVQSYLKNIPVQSLGQRDRKLCFELLDCLLECYSDAVAPLGDDLIYGVCGAIDSERDPECLMLTFHIVECLARLYPNPSGPLESFMGDLSDILGSYFPIHFTHPKGADVNVQRDALSRALMSAFSSTPLFEPFVIPLLLEKISSSLHIAKVDSLKYLTVCSAKYGADRMAKHARAIWYSVKDAICTYLEEPGISYTSAPMDGIGFQRNEIVSEALSLLQQLIMQNNGLLISLIIEDDDVNMVFKSIACYEKHNDIPAQGKQKLHAVGRILHITCKTSITSCNFVFQSLFCRLMDTLESSRRNIDSLPKDDVLPPQRFNFGFLYLCIELLAGCRDLIASSEEEAQPYDPENEACCTMVHGFSTSLFRAFGSALVVSPGDLPHDPDIYIGVKGLQILAMYPGDVLPVPKLLFENILRKFMAIITEDFDKTILWEAALNALVHIGSFIANFYESEKAMSYRCLVVKKIVDLLSCDDSMMPFSFKLQALSDISMTEIRYMLNILHGLEEAVLANLLEVYVHGNVRSAETAIQLLECFSCKLLPWINEHGNSEEFVVQFAVGIWSQIGNCLENSSLLEKKELLEAIMKMMRLSVGSCSVDSQNTIVQKAYSILSSRTNFQINELERLPLIPGKYDICDRDEWILSVFASTVIAVCPQMHIPNSRVVLHLFMISLLRGVVPAAHALGSMINKLASESNGVEVSSGCNLEEALDIIFKTKLCFSGTDILQRGSGINNGNEMVLTDLCLGFGVDRLLQINAICGLAWIGKGLLLRGHEKLKDVTMILVECLTSGTKNVSPLVQDALENTDEQNQDPSVLKCAADAFHILLSDSEVCLSRKFHAVIRPLFKQRFFSSMMPIIQQLISKSHSSFSRSLLYRACGHIMSDTPLIVIMSEAKKLIPVLVECLSMLTEDIQDKDMLYGLLLVLSGILTEKSGQEAVMENAHIIINCLIRLMHYPHKTLVRETAIQCLVAMSELPHVRIYPMRTQVLQALLKALDDTKRAVRQEAVRCRQAWASIASRSLHF